jgi:NAD(P)-dependent dehydrogenase (short-subunit alcohol dehydrogenase family)
MSLWLPAVVSLKFCSCEREFDRTKASGMGLAVTERLVELGWNVALLDFNETKAQEVAERLGPQIFFIKSNVAVWEQLSKAFVKSWEKYGRLDFGM